MKWLSVALLGSLLVPLSAKAELRAERDPSANACPDEASFVARAKQNPRVAERSAASSRDVTVRFGKGASGYVASIRTSDGMVRTLDDSSCEALADAALVIVALAIDEGSVSAPPPAASSPVAVSTPPRDPPARDAGREAPPSSARSGSSLGFDALVGAAFASGLGSSSAPGARIGASLAIGEHGSVGITGLWLATQSTAFSNGSVDVGVLGGGVEGCGRLPAGRFGAALCARGEGFRLEGSARGFTSNASRARPVFTASLLARGDVRLAGQLGMFLEAGATAPLAKERFEITGLGTVYDPPVVAFTGAAGARLHFE